MQLHGLFMYLIKTSTYFFFVNIGCLIKITEDENEEKKIRRHNTGTLKTQQYWEMQFTRLAFMCYCWIYHEGGVAREEEKKIN